MQTLQSVKYNRIEAIIKSVGIEASKRDILMLVAEIDVAPQFICAAHVIPVLYKNKDKELKDLVEHTNKTEMQIYDQKKVINNICKDMAGCITENQHLKDVLHDVKKHALGIKDRRTSDINTIDKLTKELKESLNQNYQFAKQVLEADETQKSLEEALRQANETSQYYVNKSNELEHKYNNLVKHCDKVKEQLEQERRTTTTQSMRIALMEAKVIKINELLK